MRIITINGSLQETAELLIQNAEGFSPTWYKDSFGNDTIGYGFKAGGMAQKYLGGMQTITEQEGIDILYEIISDIVISLNAGLSFFKGLQKNQKAVLIDMAYNLGLNQFYTFNLFIYYMGLEQFDDAVADLTQTLWYNQVKNRAIRDCFNLFAQEGNLYLI